MRRALLLITFITAVLTANIAQPGDPPNLPGHGMNGNQGGNAPVGSGLVILLAMGSAYGARKVYKNLKDKEQYPDE